MKKITQIQFNSFDKNEVLTNTIVVKGGLGDIRKPDIPPAKSVESSNKYLGR